MNIVDRGATSVTIAFAANELLTIINAHEVAARAATGDDADAYRRAQRPLVDALRTLRPKLNLSESTGLWTTDWPRSEQGKHL